jgi:hypothetical protein
MEKEDLKKFLDEHFTYEVEMVSYAIVSWKKYHQPFDQNGINMSLECLFFHGRNLLEFFYYKPAKDYSRAPHFIDDNKWKLTRPDKTKNVLELEKRTSNEVVHLTYKRMAGSPPEKQWDPIGCFKDLTIITKEFLNLLPDDMQGDRIISLKNNIDKLQIN